MLGSIPYYSLVVVEVVAFGTAWIRISLGFSASYEVSVVNLSNDSLGAADVVVPVDEALTKAGWVELACVLEALYSSISSLRDSFTEESELMESFTAAA